MAAEGDAAAGERERVVIGLSFGNSYSSVAAPSTAGAGGDVIVIANEEGDRQIPSILAYVDGEEFHGTQAKAQLVRNGENTVSGFRDYLGKSFSGIDPTPAEFSAKPLDHNSTVAFSVRDSQAGEPSNLTVSEVTTRHLKRLKQSASDYLGKEVNSAVVAVATDFGDAQRQELVKCAAAAGIEVLQIISEPIAALLAADRRTAVGAPQDRIAVVADLGATRSDAAVVSVRGGMYATLATVHDYTLGGTGLDALLMDYFAKEFLKKNKNAADPRKNSRSLAKLKLESEAVKKALSLGSTAGFNVESLSDGIDFSATINRARYELLAGKLFGQFAGLVTSVVAKAGLDVLDIDQVLITGGTAHTPRLAQNLKGAFPESTRVIAPATDPGAVNPSELTVRGAALQALLIGDYEADDIHASTQAEVTAAPHLSKAVGLSLGEGFFEILPAETPLPVRRTVTLKMAAGDGRQLIRIVEGEREIRVTEPVAKEKKAKADDEEDDDDDDDEDEDEPLREKVVTPGAALAELALPAGAGGKTLTLQLNMSADGAVTVSAQAAGGSGVKGTVGGAGAANGAAH